MSTLWEILRSFQIDVFFIIEVNKSTDSSIKKPLSNLA